jgi:hypothetical protein
MEEQTNYREKDVSRTLSGEVALDVPARNAENSRRH